MDIAAFKVSYSADIDATALRAARARSSSMGAMDDSSRNPSKLATPLDPTMTPPPCKPREQGQAP
eukprot:scaffold41667_cov65-Phaeocystis_antarctica.AAC.2